MQQTANNMNGRQAIVLAQTAPIDTESRSIIMTSEHAKQFARFGLVHLAIGISCVVFQIVSITVAISRLSFVGHGIWTGSVFVVTGVLGILAAKKGGKCQVITFNVFSIISAVFSLALMCIAISSAVNAAYATNYETKTFYKGVIALAVEVLLAALAIIEIIVAIWSSATCFMIGQWFVDFRASCCCPTDPQYHQFVNPVQPDFARQQFIDSNQQQEMFSTNQQQIICNPRQQQLAFNTTHQQPMLNTNQQQPMFNPNQQQPVFNTNQQQPTFSTNQQQLTFFPNQQQLMFNPNQQQLMFNPNQQQLMFNPNQQLLMFNPNQQQPMFFPTQPLTGFYPQQQAVQCYVYQPHATLNSQQPDFSAFSTGATGQGPDAGPHSEPIATPLPEETTGNSGGNGSDEGPGFADDVAMLSLEGDSENRY